jgi:hypothetical protein
MTSNDTGENNVAIGFHALDGTTTENQNIAIGNLAGSSYTSNEFNNILIGSNQTGTVGKLDVIRIGDAQTKCWYLWINFIYR